MKKLVLGLLSLTLIATACKKSKDSTPITKETITGTYKMTAAKLTVSGVPGSHDAFADMSDCQKDDLYKLNADYTFDYVDAGTICNPAGDFSDVWSLSGNQLTLYGTTGTITKFDGSILEVTVTTTDQGTTYTSTTTFQKQ